MSDQSALFADFLKRQQDILGGYQKGILDLKQDLQSLTRLLLDDQKGETFIDAGTLINANPSYKIQGNTWQSAPPFTVLPLPLKNAKKIRLVYSNTFTGDPGGIANPIPIQFYGAYGENQSSLTPLEFSLFGTCINAFAGGNPVQYVSFYLDQILPCAGEKWLHLYGWDISEMSANGTQDFFSVANNCLQFNYQLIA